MSDMVAARPRLMRLGNQITGIDLSPSGNRVVAEARGELFSIPVKNGETRNLTESTSSRERLPAWSPDGKSIAYFSDAGGENQLYVMPQMGGPAEKLTSAPSLNPVGLSWSPDGKMLSFATRDFCLYVVDVASKKLTKVATNRYAGMIGYDWSPDSKWIAYIDTAINENSRAMLYEVASGKSTPVTDGYYTDTGVAFDTSGKYLYLTSNRTFAPSFGLYEFSLKVTDSERIYAILLSKEMSNPLMPPPDEEPAAPPAPWRTLARPSRLPAAIRTGFARSPRLAAPNRWSANICTAAVGRCRRSP